MAQSIISGKADTTVYLNNAVLSSVADAAVSEESNYTPVYEMLSAEPWSVRKEKTLYSVKLNQVSDTVPEFPESFTLSFISDASAISFDGCIVKSSESVYDSSGRIVTVTKIISRHKERIV